MSQRVKTPKIPLDRRRTTFQEVAQTITPEEARQEAERCLQCKNPPCVKGCPVGVPIPEFIAQVARGDFGKAAETILAKNALPAVCGRVCPQESQCEGVCIRGVKAEPLAIGMLERFVAQFAPEQSGPGEPVPELRGKKVAVIGSGPAGLTAAADLAKAGMQVTVFESLHAAGGVLRYGIPEFRLPKAILEAEIEAIKALGVEIKLNTLVGKTVTLDDLRAQGYQAFFIASGAGLPSFLEIPGENLNGVYSANEFLTRVNLMRAYESKVSGTPVRVGKRVAVFGAGNVAMDAARTALRLGAEDVRIVYRRSRAEMPARLEEIENAEEEGVKFELLVSPVEFVGDERGWVKAVVLQKMELTEPGPDGRRRPVPIEGSEYTLPIDTAIIAIGQSPNPILFQSIPELQLGPKGNVVVDAEGRTNIPDVWTGGDAATGAATVIQAMGAGRTAARSIINYLSTEV